MQMSVVCTAAMLMSVGRAVVEDHTDLSGLHCHLSPCWCLWCLGPCPAAARGHVHGLCCHQKACGSPQPVILQAVKSKDGTSAGILMTTDTVEKEGHGRLL